MLWEPWRTYTMESMMIPRCDLKWLVLSFFVFLVEKCLQKKKGKGKAVATENSTNGTTSPVAPLPATSNIPPSSPSMNDATADKCSPMDATAISPSPAPAPTPVPVQQDTPQPDFAVGVWSVSGTSRMHVGWTPHLPRSFQSSSFNYRQWLHHPLKRWICARCNLLQGLLSRVRFQVECWLGLGLRMMKLDVMKSADATMKHL